MTKWWEIRHRLLMAVMLLACLWAGQSHSGQASSHSRMTSGTSHGPRIKILCWVMSTSTTANNAKSKAIHDTWGARCDKLLVVKNGTHLKEEGNQLTLPIGVHEGRDQLWHKVAQTFMLIYEKHLNDYDWFFKADDDTYLLVGALREFLSRRSSPNELVYFGRRFKPFVRQGYMSGGSGYVLSRAALKLMIEKGFARGMPECELETGQVEDLVIGRCLEACGVEAGDARDSHGKETFLPLSPESLLYDKIEANHWYHTYAPEGSDTTTGSKQCCSARPISFHYISPRLMYLIDWLLYDVKPRLGDNDK